MNDLYEIIEKTDNKVSVLLNASHAIFAAHFPGAPITPGAILVQMAQDLFNIPTVSEVCNVKFQTAVDPRKVSQITFVCEQKDDFRFDITVESGNVSYAKMQLITPSFAAVF